MICVTYYPFKSNSFRKVLRVPIYLCDTFCSSFPSDTLTSGGTSTFTLYLYQLKVHKLRYQRLVALTIIYSQRIHGTFSTRKRSIDSNNSNFPKLRSVCKRRWNERYDDEDVSFVCFLNLYFIFDLSIYIK